MTPRAPHALRRIRLTFVHSGSGSVIHDEHLRADPGTAHRWASLADVVLGEEGDFAALAAYPGALVVAVPRRDQCWMRLGGTGATSETVHLTAAAHGATVCWATCASVAHAWLIAAGTDVSVRRCPLFT
ncbi:hypothetical protein ACIBUY_34155 [Streptomyces sp. NPDC050085]|uniref:hypothetical protein n=1 Tax=Streptomyces sp. NPDC050085 TaxID=3365600 RepID=UPI0037B78622